jgi:hypothetical protein
MFFLHIGIGTRRGRTTDRKLHVDTLILIPTLKIYVLCYSRQTDGQTDGEIYPVRASLTTFLQVNVHTPAARGLEELISTVLERLLQPIHALRV